jgi:hypothetical protein
VLQPNGVEDIDCGFTVASQLDERDPDVEPATLESGISPVLYFETNARPDSPRPDVTGVERKSLFVIL